MRYRVLLAAVAVLVAAGACGDSGSDPVVPPGVMASIEGFTEASTRYDTESMRTYLTEDFTWQSTGPVQPRDDFLAYVDRYWEASQFRYAATGEPAIRLDGEAYVVEEPGLATAVGLELTGTSVYRVVEVDGRWLIQEVRWSDAPTSGSTD